MPAQRFSVFWGESPKIAPRLLPEGAAQAAVNLRLTSGRIDPVFYPLEVNAVLRAGIKTIYRMYDHEGDYWLNWASDVDVVKGPIAGDTTFRTYFASDDFEPRVTNLSLVKSGGPPYPQLWYVLGVTPPKSAPTATATGGASTEESRAYVYTYVTAWGEESAPSPASVVVTGKIDATWTVTMPDLTPPNFCTISNAAWAGGFMTFTVDTTFGLRAGEWVVVSGLAPAAINSGYRIESVLDATSFRVEMADPGSITTPTGVATRVSPHNVTGMKKRLYRSVTSSTSTEYYFVKEVDVTTSSTNDDVGANIGEPLMTQEWDMPPTGLRGLRTLPNGSLVGFLKNQLCFSEPLAPYAWPESYRLTTDHDIVGIGVFGTSIAVITKGQPYIATGVDPLSMTMTKIDQHWPGVSKRGIASVTGGVVWPTTYGLAMLSDSGPALVTEQHYSRVEWMELEPKSFIGAFFDNRYYAGYQIDHERFGIFIFDGLNQTTYRASLLVEGMYSDYATGELYVIHEGKIKHWDANPYARLPFEWWSREMVVPPPVNLGAARVEADFSFSSKEIEEHNKAAEAQVLVNEGYISGGTTGGSLNGSSLHTYSMNGSAIVTVIFLTDGTTGAVTFMLYVNGEFYSSKTVYSTTTFRLPAGRKYDVFSIRLLGNVPVNAVLIGDTPSSLREA